MLWCAAAWLKRVSVLTDPAASLKPSLLATPVILLRLLTAFLPCRRQCSPLNPLLAAAAQQHPAATLFHAGLLMASRMWLKT